MILTKPNQYQFEVRPDDDRNSDAAIVRETWEENVYQIHEGDFAPNGVFIDLGANIGVVGTYVSKMRPDVKILAYEPEANNLELLRKNILLNNAPMLVVKKAVSNFNGEAYMTNDEGGSELVYDEGEKVEVITLADVLKDIDRCDVMKVDVESSEYPIFTDASVEDLLKIKYLTMEFTNTDAQTYGLLMSSLSRAFNIHAFGSYDRGGMIYGRSYNG